MSEPVRTLGIGSLRAYGVNVPAAPAADAVATMPAVVPVTAAARREVARPAAPAAACRSRVRRVKRCVIHLPGSAAVSGFGEDNVRWLSK
jgi:hypothetical protein